MFWEKEKECICDVYLTLGVLSLLDTKPGFVHRFLDDTDRVRTLCGWIDTFFGYESGNFFSEGRKIMLAFFLVDLDFPFLENLSKGLRLSAWLESNIEWTSLTMSSWSVVLKAFWRSWCLASSPFETFTKMLEIWRTSSRFFSTPFLHSCTLFL